MNQLFTFKDTVNFMAYRRPMSWLSFSVILLSLVLLMVRGLNLGLDFTGGTLVEVAFERSVVATEIRGHLDDAGFDNATVQNYGSSRDILVRLPPLEGSDAVTLNNEITAALKQVDDNVEVLRTEFVGPAVGAELLESAVLAMLAALIAILMYVGFRFEWRLAAGSVFALFHDVTLIFGFYALTQMEFNLTTVAGVLSVIGYSLNDTIVVFDRIRENFRKMRKGDELEIVNASLTQTLSRTIVTSGTTLFVLFALYFAGGAMMETFAASLIVGIFFGTYSSIYIASAAALKLGLTRESLLPEVIEKEGADQEPML